MTTQFPKSYTQEVAVTDVRIFVGPTDIAGMYSNLLEGLVQSGVQAELVERAPHPSTYVSKHHAKHFLLLMSRNLSKNAQESRMSDKSRFSSAALQFLANCLWLAYTPSAFFRYQTFLFSFGRSLWPLNLDLPILKLFRKTVVMNLAHGSEARPSYLDGSFQNFNAGHHKGAKKLASLAKRARRAVRMAEKYADNTVGNPLSTHFFTTKPFVNCFQIGMPLPNGLEFYSFPESEVKTQEKKRYIVLHAPSNKAAKGTDAILQAIEELRDEGMDIETKVISGVANREVLRAIKDSDLIVDQLYSDTPMAGLALEASSFGKATIVGGYGLTDLGPYLPPGMGDVTITCMPEELKATIRGTFLSGNFEPRGKLAKQFVTENFQPFDVAKRWLQILLGRVPKSWMVDPDEVSYLHGIGQSSEVSVRQIRGMVHLLGVRSLQLGHKIRLQNSILKFAGLEEPKTSIAPNKGIRDPFTTS